MLALGLLPLASGLVRGRARRLSLVLAGWVALSAALAWAAVRLPAGTPFPEAGRPIQVVAEEYVASGACQSCHPAQYATWRTSYHRTMTQLATPDVVRGTFDGGVVGSPDGTYRLERRGEEFYANDERILMTTGSHHMQAYWVSRHEGRSVELVQLVYLFDERRWIPRRDAFLQPPGVPPRSDEWNANCVECHSTHARPRLADDADTWVNEFGIACEACHGPAAAHVAANHSPLRRYQQHLGNDGRDTTVVNPRRLSARRASQVCARCHAITVFPTEELKREYWEGAGDRHRPGHDLEQTGHVLLGPRDPLGPTAESDQIEAYKRDTMFWPDGPSRGSGREFNAMVFSPCFGSGESPDNVSCLSCHEMHQGADDPRPDAEWANDQLKRGMDGDQACLQCHDRDLGPDLGAHTHHGPASEGSRCYNCHMPHTTYGLLKAIRSHHISSPAVSTDLATGRPNACNLCHLDRSLGWTAERLERWYGTPVPALDAEQRDVAASIRWLLAGEARQRVLLAWHAGWPPARTASGNDWIAPFLAPLLSDPYAAVRLVAARSIRTLPGFHDFPVDPVGAPAHIAEAAGRAWQRWAETGTARREPALLMRPEGLDGQAMGALLSRRDDRPVGVVE